MSYRINHIKHDPHVIPLVRSWGKVAMLPERKLTNRSCTRMFLFLGERENLPPSNRKMDKLVKKDKVKEITFTQEDIAQQIGQLLLATFPIPLGTDLSGTPAKSGLDNFDSEKSWPSYFVDKKDLVGRH